MLTISQRNRLDELAKELDRVKVHPSPTVRARVAEYSDKDIAKAIIEIGLCIAEDDGHEAWTLINARYRNAEAEVIKEALAVNKQHSL